MNIGELLPEMWNLSVYYLGSMMGPQVEHHLVLFWCGIDWTLELFQTLGDK